MQAVVVNLGRALNLGHAQSAACPTVVMPILLAILRNFTYCQAESEDLQLPMRDPGVMARGYILLILSLGLIFFPASQSKFVRKLECV